MTSATPAQRRDTQAGRHAVVGVVVVGAAAGAAASRALSPPPHPPPRLREVALGPAPDAKKGSVFDALEDTDAPDCLARLVELDGFARGVATAGPKLNILLQEDLTIRGGAQLWLMNCGARLQARRRPARGSCARPEPLVGAWGVRGVTSAQPMARGRSRQRRRWLRRGTVASALAAGAAAACASLGLR